MGKRSNKWRPLEANPEVMVALSKTLGGPAYLIFEDLLSFEDWGLEMVAQPVRALLFLYPITKKFEDFSKLQNEKIKTKGQILSPHLFFIKQTISNACGTIGLMHALLNMQADTTFESGKFLDNFIVDTIKKTPAERAKYLEESEGLEASHKEVEKQGATKPPTEEEADVNTHFVTFVALDGHLYELDGRKEFPINHGPSSTETLLKDAAKVIQESFINLEPSENRFTMITMSGQSPTAK